MTRTPQRPRPRSPGGIAVALGLLLLGATFYVPVAAARRTARIEERGEQITGWLLEVARPLADQPLDADWVREVVQARLLLLCAARSVPSDDLHLLPPDVSPGAMTLRNKHYHFQLRRSPPPDAPEAPNDGGRVLGTDLPLECVGWPSESVGPAHAAFFASTVAEPAFTRNLVVGYVGENPAKWPAPGAPHRRSLERHPWTYRGADDERWLLRDRPEDLGHARSR